MASQTAAAFSSSYSSSSGTGARPSAFQQLLYDEESVFDTTASPLQQVLQLKKPTYEEMLRRDPYDYCFWDRYGSLLGKAWKEWADNNTESLPTLRDETVLHDHVVRTFNDVWADPSKEENKVHSLRTYFDMAAESGVPCRPPHGITLNRKGFMLDERSPGYLAVPAFQQFYRELIDKYMRPSGRLLYPEFISAADDSESFAFSIQYQPNKDQAIRQHTDASALTFNINMNLPDEEFSGSGLYFVDPTTGNKKYVSFGVGEAIVHRGVTPHAALPITSGTRSNLVMWLYGPNGSFNYMSPYEPQEQLTLEDRWAKNEKSTCSTTDTWAPF